jgi:D-cysteine desulfhydrase
MDISRFPRRQYTQGFSPIEFLPNFTRALGGPKVWIKRDDMLGLAPGGNKTRKLEFLMGDALAKGADTLITCGAPQSNHCRITLSAAVKEGLKCRFVIEERVPNSYDPNASGNNFMYRLLVSKRLLLSRAGTNMAEAMEKMAAEARSQGRKPYIIPGGGSNAVGGWAMSLVPKSYSSNSLRWVNPWITWWWVPAALAHTVDSLQAFLATTFGFPWWVLA